MLRHGRPSGPSPPSASGNGVVTFVSTRSTDKTTFRPQLRLGARFITNWLLLETSRTGKCFRLQVAGGAEVEGAEAPARPCRRSWRSARKWLGSDGRTRARIGGRSTTCQRVRSTLCYVLRNRQALSCHAPSARLTTWTGQPVIVPDRLGANARSSKEGRVGLAVAEPSPQLEPR